MKKIFILLTLLSVLPKLYAGGAVELRLPSDQADTVLKGSTVNLELEYLHGPDYHDGLPETTTDPSEPTRGHTETINSVDWSIESDGDGDAPDNTFNSTGENLGTQQGATTSPAIVFNDPGVYTLTGKAENVDAVDDHGLTIPSSELDGESSDTVTINVLNLYFDPDPEPEVADGENEDSSRPKMIAVGEPDGGTFTWSGDWQNLRSDPADTHIGYMDTTSTGDKIATVSYGFGGDTVSITHDYTVISVGDISVDVTGIVVDSGDTITFTANPDPSGYDFFYTQWEKQKDGGSWESVTLDGNETETLEADEGAGEYKFRAKHTEYGAWAESETVYIAELESLEPDQGEEIDDGDGDPKTRLFVMPPATNGVVTVTATLNPEIDESKLPDGWTIEGGDGSGKLERTVDATQPSETEFTFSYNRTDSKYKTRLEIGNIEITDLDITSPASDGKWPYDPAWHDTAWEPSVNGGLIMSIALEEDIASFSFSLNRDAQIDVIAKKDELGPDGIYKLLPIINGEIGENEIEFNVGNWPSNKYYLQVDADGGLSDGDIDSKESEKFVINRLALYLQLAENIDSVDIDNNENLVVAESNIHNVTQDHLTVPIIFGNALLSRLPGGTAKVLATAASFAILISDIAELPGWVEVGNVLYFYGPWTIKKATYNFESGQYDIFKNYKIAAMEAYDFGQGIEIVLPPVDREPAQGTPQYYNDGFGPTKTDEEFKKSAWDGGYGLVPPTLNP